MGVTALAVDAAAEHVYFTCGALGTVLRTCANPGPLCNVGVVVLRRWEGFSLYGLALDLGARRLFFSEPESLGVVSVSLDAPWSTAEELALAAEPLPIDPIALQFQCDDTCADGTYAVTSCTSASGVTCSPCHVACHRCYGPEATDCLACSDGYNLRSGVCIQLPAVYAFAQSPGGGTHIRVAPSWGADESDDVVVDPLGAGTSPQRAMAVDSLNHIVFFGSTDLYKISIEGKPAASGPAELVASVSQGIGQIALDVHHKIVYFSASEDGVLSCEYICQQVSLLHSVSGSAGMAIDLHSGTYFVGVGESPAVIQTGQLDGSGSLQDLFESDGSGTMLTVHNIAVDVTEDPVRVYWSDPVSQSVFTDDVTSSGKTTVAVGTPYGLLFDVFSGMVLFVDASDNHIAVVDVVSGPFGSVALAGVATENHGIALAYHSDCPAGFGGASGVCQRCLTNCQRCSTTGAPCDVCMPGFVLSSDGMTCDEQFLYWVDGNYTLLRSPAVASGDTSSQAVADLSRVVNSLVVAPGRDRLFYGDYETDEVVVFDTSVEAEAVRLTGFSGIGPDAGPTPNYPYATQHIAVDVLAERIFVTREFDGIIESVDWSGSQRTMLYQSSDHPDIITPQAPVFRADTNTLYWLEPQAQSGVVLAASGVRDTDSITTVVDGLGTGVRALALELSAAGHRLWISGEDGLFSAFLDDAQAGLPSSPKFVAEIDTISFARQRSEVVYLSNDGSVSRLTDDGTVELLFSTDPSVSRTVALAPIGCADGTYRNTLGECEPCDFSCYRCSGPTAGDCVGESCGHGFYYDAESGCQACHSLCEACDGPGNADCLPRGMGCSSAAFAAADGTCQSCSEECKTCAGPAGGFDCLSCNEQASYAMTEFNGCAAPGWLYVVDAASGDEGSELRLRRLLVGTGAVTLEEVLVADVGTEVSSVAVDLSADVVFLVSSTDRTVYTASALNAGAVAPLWTASVDLTGICLDGVGQRTFVLAGPADEIHVVMYGGSSTLLYSSQESVSSPLACAYDHSQDLLWWTTAGQPSDLSYASASGGSTAEQYYFHTSAMTGLVLDLRHSRIFFVASDGIGVVNWAGENDVEIVIAGSGVVDSAGLAWDPVEETAYWNNGGSLQIVQRRPFSTLSENITALYATVGFSALTFSSPNCLPTTFPTGGTCQMCHSSCSSAAGCVGPGPSDCRACDIGFWLNDGACTSASVCESNEYVVAAAAGSSDTVCGACDSSCVDLSDSAACTGPGPEQCLSVVYWAVSGVEIVYARIGDGSSHSTALWVDGSPFQHISGMDVDPRAGFRKLWVADDGGFPAIIYTVDMFGGTPAVVTDSLSIVPGALSLDLTEQRCFVVDTETSHIYWFEMYGSGSPEVEFAVSVGVSILSIAVDPMFGTILVSTADSVLRRADTASLGASNNVMIAFDDNAVGPGRIAIDFSQESVIYAEFNSVSNIHSGDLSSSSNFGVAVADLPVAPDTEIAALPGHLVVYGGGSGEESFVYAADTRTSEQFLVAVGNTLAGPLTAASRICNDACAVGCVGPGEADCLAYICAFDAVLIEDVCRSCNPACDGCHGISEADCQSCAFGFDRVGGKCVENAPMLWVENNLLGGGSRIMRAASYSGATEELLFESEAALAGLAVDPVANALFIGDASGILTTSYSSSLGSQPTRIAAVGDAPSMLALEPEEKLIYYTVFNSGTIQRVDYDGVKSSEVLWGGTDVEGAWGIALDTAIGRLVFTDVSGGGSIKSARMDGTGSVAVLMTGRSDPRAIALDIAGSRMVWVEQELGVFWAPYSGTDVPETDFAVIGLGSLLSNARALSLDPLLGTIFLADAVLGHIVAIDIDAESPTASAITLISSTGVDFGQVVIDMRTCPNATHKAATSCQGCEVGAGCHTCSSSRGCDACADSDKYANNDGVCVLCSEQPVPSECPASTFSRECGSTFDAGCQSCSECGSGSYVAVPCDSSADVVCEPCNAECATCTNENQCDQFAIGEFFITYTETESTGVLQAVSAGGSGDFLDADDALVAEITIGGIDLDRRWTQRMVYASVMDAGSEGVLRIAYDSSSSPEFVMLGMSEAPTDVAVDTVRNVGFAAAPNSVVKFRLDFPGVDPTQNRNVLGITGARHVAVEPVSGMLVYTVPSAGDVIAYFYEEDSEEKLAASLNPIGPVAVLAATGTVWVAAGGDIWTLAGGISDENVLVAENVVTSVEALAVNAEGQCYFAGQSGVVGSASLFRVSTDAPASIIGDKSGTIRSLAIFTADCHQSCAICSGTKPSDCLVCARGWFPGDVGCSTCGAGCARCFGPSATECLECDSGFRMTAADPLCRPVAAVVAIDGETPALVSFPADLSSPPTEIAQLTGTARAVGVDERAGSIFLGKTDPASGIPYLYMHVAPGGNTELVQVAQLPSLPTDLSVDPANELVYFTSTTGTISSCDYAGTVTVLFDGETSTDTAVSIVVDSSGSGLVGHLYWTQYDSDGRNFAWHAPADASVDAQLLRTLTIEQAPSNLALWLPTEQLFFTKEGSGVGNRAIETLPLDGGEPGFHESGLQAGEWLVVDQTGPTPFALVAGASRVQWVSPTLAPSFTAFDDLDVQGIALEFASCPAGFYSGGGTCQRCHETCGSCDWAFATSCIACATGYGFVSDGEGSTCQLVELPTVVAFSSSNALELYVGESVALTPITVGGVGELLFQMGTSLPTGLTMTSSGVITGTPSIVVDAEMFHFSVSIQGVESPVASFNVTITVFPADLPPVLQSAVLSDDGRVLRVVWSPLTSKSIVIGDGEDGELRCVDLVGVVGGPAALEGLQCEYLDRGGVLLFQPDNGSGIDVVPGVTQVEIVGNLIGDTPGARRISNSTVTVDIRDMLPLEITIDAEPLQPVCFESAPEATAIATGYAPRFAHWAADEETSGVLETELAPWPLSADLTMVASWDGSLGIGVHSLTVAVEDAIGRRSNASAHIYLTAAACVPRFQSAMLHPTLSGMTIQFEGDTDQGGFLSSFECSELFALRSYEQLTPWDRRLSSSEFWDDDPAFHNANSTALEGAECKWDSPSSVTMLFGPAGFVFPGTYIVIREGASLHSLLGNPPLPYVDDGGVFIDTPEEVVRPVARIVAPALLTSCDSLTIDGTNSGPAVQYYYWSGSMLPGDRTGDDEAAPTDGLEALQTSMSEANEATGLTGLAITLPGGVLDAGVTYRIQLDVSNYLSTGLSVLFDIEVTEEYIPQIRVDGPSVVSFARSEAATIRVFALPPPCTALQSVGLRFSFRALDSMAGVNAGESLQEFAAAHDERILKFPARALEVGGPYRVRARVEVVDNADLAAEIDVFVTVLASPLIASLTGAGGSFPVSSALSLTASASHDPDGDSTLDFVWACVFDGFGTPCADAGGGVLSYPTTPVFAIPPFTFAVGARLRFAVMVTSSAGFGRVASKSVVVEIVQGDPPHVSVDTPLVDRVPPNSRTVLRGEVSAPGGQPIDEADLSLRWSVLRGSLELGESALSQGATKTELNRIDLVVSPGVLAPGAQYTFRLTATPVGSTSPGFAEVVIVTNAPPFGGSVGITPTTGVMVETAFDITTSGWVDDPRDLPLKYEFGTGTSTRAPLADVLLSPRLDRSPLPRGTGQNSVLTVYAIAIDTLGARSAAATVVATVTAPQKQTGETTSGYVVRQVRSTVKSNIDTRRPEAATAAVAALAEYLNEEGAPDANVDVGEARSELASGLRQASELTEASEATLLQMMRAAASVTGDPGSLGTAAVDSIFDVLGVLPSLAEESPPNVLDETGVSALIALSNVQRAEGAGNEDDSGDSARRFLRSGRWLSRRRRQLQDGSGCSAACQRALDVADKLRDSIDRVAAGVIESAVPGELPVALQGGLLSVVSLRERQDRVASRDIKLEASSEALAYGRSDAAFVRFGPDFLDVGSRSAQLDIHTVRLELNPFESAAGLQIGSAVVGVDVFDRQGAEVHVVDANGRLQLAIPFDSTAYDHTIAPLSDTLHRLSCNGDETAPVNAACEGIGADLAYDCSGAPRVVSYRCPQQPLEPSCRYWDDDAQVWSGDGCEFVAANESHVLCSCSHATEFGAAFLRLERRFVDVIEHVDDISAEQVEGSIGVIITVGAVHLVMYVIAGWGYCKDNKDAELQHAKARRKQMYEKLAHAESKGRQIAASMRISAADIAEAAAPDSAPVGDSTASLGAQERRRKRLREILREQARATASDFKRLQREEHPWVSVFFAYSPILSRPERVALVLSVIMGDSKYRASPKFCAPSSLAKCASVRHIIGVPHRRGGGNHLGRPYRSRDCRYFRHNSFPADLCVYVCQDSAGPRSGC